MNIYTPASVSTPDLTAPVPGTAIVFTNPTLSSLTVSWGVASDNVTLPGALQYKVVKASAATAIDSLLEVDAIATAGAGLVMDWTAATLTTGVTGLTSLTDYNFAVAVKDAAGHEALYSPQYVTTAGKIFVTASSSTGDLGGIAGADAKCQSDTNKPADGRTYKALISVNTGTAATSRIACTSANCTTGGAGEHTDWVLKDNTPYTRTDGTAITTTSALGLFNFNLTIPIKDSLQVAWTGLVADFTPKASHCVRWTSAAGGSDGGSGIVNQQASNAIDGGETTCSHSSALLYCIEQ